MKQVGAPRAACWLTRVLALALVCGAALLPAAAGKTEDILLGIEDLQKQMLLLTREQARTSEALNDIQRRIGDQAGSVQNVQADLLQKVDALIEEMQILRQRLDDTGSHLISLTQEMRRLQTGTAGSTAAGASGGPNVAGPTTATTPDQIFKGAYADFSKGNYQLALWGFQDFLRKFPSDPRASEALYWIGECYFSQADYPKAVTEFDRLVQQYPDSMKVAAAYLKKGLALLEANQVAQAVVQLQHVVQNYPHSSEARIAHERLATLGLN